VQISNFDRISSPRKEFPPPKTTAPLPQSNAMRKDFAHPSLGFNVRFCVILSEAKDLARSSARHDCTFYSQRDWS